MKKIVIISLVLILIALLCAIGFIPVKYAVYADKDDERRMAGKSEHSLRDWYNEKKADYSELMEYSDVSGRPKWKFSGKSYIGENAEDYETPIYYNILWNSPLWWLNTNFSSPKANNAFAIRYTQFRDGTSIKKDGYYTVPIIITDWTPTYPIRRSGWLASRLLPDDRLVIWDFIGWRACW